MDSSIELSEVHAMGNTEEKSLPGKMFINHYNSELRRK
jgi:hypothetical protein